MCGIAGSVNTPLTIDDVNLIGHRGPDLQALEEIEMGSNKIYFGHTRLSIQDLSSAGNQPMFTDCGNYCIVFNGEIYNHWDLRKKLTGIRFSGQSDTETILYYLREFGIDAVKDFNGIFAFALLNKATQKIYLVRDSFGVKPLYYYAQNNVLVFGSEIKIIKNNPAYQEEIDTSALNTFMSFRYNPAPQTLFKGIKKLEAATYMEFDRTGKIRFCNYWPKKQQIIGSIDETEAIAEYKRLLEQAVTRQLLSDVPVGLLLSGGMDSAVLGFLMAKHTSSPIKTFTVGFKGKGNFNEMDDARETASLINSEHHDVFMDREQYMDYFYKSFYHTEEPIAEPTIPALFYLSNLASKHVKVVISGQGADEPMAGYKRYQGEKLISEYQGLLSMLPLKLLLKAFPNNSTIARGVYSAQFKDELDRFVGIYTLFTPSMKQKLYQPGMLSTMEENQNVHFARQFGLTDQNADSLSKLLFLDTRAMLPDNLLLFNDKMTMANSIENRVPFLDIDLINFIESLPIEMKLRGRTGKYIHRKATAEWLPQTIIDRKKRGFETPVGDWFKEELSHSLLDLVDSADSFSRNYFDIGFVKKMVNLHRAKKRDYQRHLFILLSLELWYRDFYKVKTERFAIAF